MARNTENNETRRASTGRGRVNNTRSPQQGNEAPMSKSEMIRDLHNRGYETGEIRKELMSQGMKIHYSEIYGALDRAHDETPSNRQDDRSGRGRSGRNEPAGDDEEKDNRRSRGRAR